MRKKKQKEQNYLPGILDACCGGRMMWFRKDDPRALFNDKRTAAFAFDNGEYFEVAPDTLSDFKNLPFPDNSFWLVVFDPPHLHKWCSPVSWMNKKYGKLPTDAWKQELQRGFNECWRVLKEHGTLVFKWNEKQIKLNDVLSCFPVRPLFGHTTTQNLRTHWMCFHKGV